MNITETRDEICERLTGELPGTLWKPFRPGGVRENTGWLVLTGVTSENATFGELTASFNAILVLGTNEAAAAARIDSLIVPFHEAFRGWAMGVTCTPAEIPVGDNTLFTLTATFQTEVEAT